MSASITPTPNSQPFWDALRERRIHLQRCQACGSWVHFPRPRCPRCLSDDLAWQDAATAGSVFTYSVARQPTNAAFNSAGELVIAMVELDGGPRLTTNIIHIDPSDVTVGMRVKAVFESNGDDTLLKFEPE